MPVTTLRQAAAILTSVRVFPLIFLILACGAGRDEAHAILAPLDENKEIEILFDFVSCHYFDASKYPNLVELIRSQGAEPREPLEMPYRCKT